LESCAESSTRNQGDAVAADTARGKSTTKGDNQGVVHTWRGWRRCARAGTGGSWGSGTLRWRDSGASGPRAISAADALLAASCWWQPQVAVKRLLPRTARATGRKSENGAARSQWLLPAPGRRKREAGRRSRHTSQAAGSQARRLGCGRRAGGSAAAAAAPRRRRASRGCPSAAIPASRRARCTGLSLSQALLPSLSSVPFKELPLDRCE
jgi:hypothetical protein